MYFKVARHPDFIGTSGGSSPSAPDIVKIAWKNNEMEYFEIIRLKIKRVLKKLEKMLWTI